MSRPILITGFEPFGGDVTNPSAEIAQALHGRLIAGRNVVGAVLPVEFGRSRRELAAHRRRTRAELVICLGLAGNRTVISLERVAINVDDARIADKAGQRPVDAPIVASGPAAYWSTLPIKALAAALREAGVGVEISQSAGTYVCNHVFYGLMHGLRRSAGTGVRGGFIHVPPVSEVWPLARLIAAVAMAVEVAALTKHDRRESGGAIA